SLISPATRASRHGSSLLAAPAAHDLQATHPTDVFRRLGRVKLAEQACITAAVNVQGRSDKAWIDEEAALITGEMARNALIGRGGSGPPGYQRLALDRDALCCRTARAVFARVDSKHRRRNVGRQIGVRIRAVGKRKIDLTKPPCKVRRGRLRP